MKVAKYPQQGRRSENKKTVCPKCEEEYLETVWSKKQNKWKHVGVHCSNPRCDYIVKDWVELEDSSASLLIG